MAHEGTIIVNLTYYYGNNRQLIYIKNYSAYQDNKENKIHCIVMDESEKFYYLNKNKDLFDWK